MGALLSSFLLFPLNSSAQSSPRAKLSDLNNAQLKELAQYIEQWLEREVVEHHVDYFFAQNGGGGIHTTRNFLGWHRNHIRQLEDFLLKQPNGSAYVPLPAWEPTDVNGTIQPIPNYFNGWDPVANQPYLDFIDPDSRDIVDNLLSGIIGQQPPFTYDEYFDDTAPFVPYVFVDPANASNSYDMTTICNYPDVGDFSDWFETHYHARGHSQVGRAMLLSSSPGCLIFWPWHAQVDDQWRRWEDECIGNYTIVQPVPITGTVIWGGIQYIKGEVVIESGGHLTIAAGADFKFRSSVYNSYRTRIHVKSGGKLTIENGAQLDGIDILGTGGGNVNTSFEDDTPGTPGTLKGVVYNTHWEGITLEDGGTVEIFGGKIRHASTAIRNEGGGGLIQAENATFENNRRDIVMGSFSSFNKTNNSSFIVCRFVNDEPLRDAVWLSGLIGEHHHHQTYNTQPKFGPFPENHVEIYSLKGLSFKSCGFESNFSSDGTNTRRSRGIYSLASGFECDNTSFNGLDEGINASTFFEWNPSNFPRISHCDFDNNNKGIVLISAEMAEIENCNFRIPAQSTNSDTPPLGIAINAGSGFEIQGNDFRTDGSSIGADNLGIWVRNSCQIRPNWIFDNTFANIRYGVQTEAANPKLQIRCNGFEGFGNESRYAIAVASGELENQGNCFIFPAGNTWNHNTCPLVESQLYKAADALPFEYDAHSDRLPNVDCTSGGINISDCEYPYSDAPCEEQELFLAKTEAQRETRITALSNTINGLGNGPQRESLEQERLTEVYKGMASRLADNQPSTAYQYLSQKEQQGVAIHKGDLASLAMEAANFQAAFTHINQMDNADPDKNYLRLVFQVKTQGRGLGQLTQNEKDEIKGHTSGGDPGTCGAPYPEYLEFKEENPDAEPPLIIATIEEEPQGLSVPNEGTTTAAVPRTNDWSVYPNPSNGLVHVEWPGSEWAELRLYALTGQELWRGVYEAGMTLDVQHYPAGLYLLRLQWKAGVLSKSILLNH